jgi:hypothetical protein
MIHTGARRRFPRLHATRILATSPANAPTFRKNSREKSDLRWVCSMSSDALRSGICRIKEVRGIEVWFDPESSDLQTEETE